jgi:hypothetical protein
VNTQPDNSLIIESRIPLNAPHHSQIRHLLLLPLLPVHAALADQLARRRWTLYVLPALAVMQLLITRLHLDWNFAF